MASQTAEINKSQAIPSFLCNLASIECTNQLGDSLVQKKYRDEKPFGIQFLEVVDGLDLPKAVKQHLNEIYDGQLHYNCGASLWEHKQKAIVHHFGGFTEKVEEYKRIIAQDFYNLKGLIQLVIGSDDPEKYAQQISEAVEKKILASHYTAQALQSSGLQSLKFETKAKELMKPGAEVYK